MLNSRILSNLRHRNEIAYHAFLFHFVWTCGGNFFLFLLSIILSDINGDIIYMADGLNSTVNNV